MAVALGQHIKNGKKVIEEKNLFNQFTMEKCD